MNTETMIQYTAEFANESQAHAHMHLTDGMEGSLGGRVLPPTIDRLWTCQIFFAITRADAAVLGAGDLPDGMRLVQVPDALRGVLGIRS